MLLKMEETKPLFCCFLIVGHLCGVLGTKYNLYFNPVLFASLNMFAFVIWLPNIFYIIANNLMKVYLQCNRIALRIQTKMSAQQSRGRGIWDQVISFSKPT